jgi:hypothetical protein
MAAVLSPTCHTTKVVVDAADFYHHFVLQEDRDSMPTLEDEVRLVRAYKEDEEVDKQVGGIIPDFGCT